MTRRDAWARCIDAEEAMARLQITSSQIDLRNVIVAVIEERMETYTEAEQDAAARHAFNHFAANGGVEYDTQVGELLYSTVRDAVSDAMEEKGLMPDWETAQEHEPPSPFEVVGAGVATLDHEGQVSLQIDWQARYAALYAEVAAVEAPAGTQVDDVLRSHQGEYDEAEGREYRSGWFVEIVRDEPFENILIGPFDDEESATEHAQDSADVEDWCYGEAKSKGYIVDDVKVVHNPTLIPSYGVNAPVHPIYAEGACLGILPGTEA